MFRLWRKNDFLFLIIGLSLLLSEIWKQYCLTFIVGKGEYQWFYFPFQLCSVPMYMCILIWIFRRTGFRRAGLTFLADFSLLSGLIVFLDTSGMRYDYLPLTIHSYLWHVLIAGLGIYAGCKVRNHTIRSFFPAAGLFFLCCLIAEGINFRFDGYGTINMFYINPHYYMEQIFFSSMLSYLPNNAVIIIYILSAAAGAFLVHLLWVFAGKHLWFLK